MAPSPHPRGSRWLSPFWRQVAALMSGSLLAQGLNALMLPILARLFLPADFGLFGVFLAAVAVMAVVVNLGYELTLVLPASDQEAQGLLALSLRAMAAVSTGLLLLLLLSPAAWFTNIGLEGLRPWYWLLPLSIALEGVIQPYSFALNRQRAYRALTRVRVGRAVATSLVSLAAGWLGGGFPGLLVGHLSGQVVAAVLSLIAYRRPAGGAVLPDWRSLARRYRDFLRYGVLSAWLNVASKQVAFFLLPGYYGEAMTGQFSKAERVLNLPPGLISMTVGRVFYEEASRRQREAPDQLWPITRRSAWQIALFGLPVLLAILGWGPQLFEFVLGAPWAPAGEYARRLVPWLYLTMIASPLSYLIDIKRKLPQFLLYNLALFLLRTGVLIWAGSRFDALTTVTWFGAVGAVLVAAQIAYLLWLARQT